MSKFIMLKLMATHTLTLLIGVAAGIYMLPLLTAGDGPDKNILDQVMENRHYSGTFSRDREDSDLLHWGEGELSIGPSRIAFSGRLAPGPDYRLYLSPVSIETERAFIEQKESLIYIIPALIIIAFAVKGASLYLAKVIMIKMNGLQNLLTQLLFKLVIKLIDVDQHKN